MKIEEVEPYWNNQVKKLVGKTIKSVRYLTEEEADAFGWSNRTIVILFTDGTELIPSMDDEGNNGGAMFSNIKGLEIIPVI